ncbi:MAG TPA: choice-of-anchor P family protein [Thermoleophilaceae bacterium]|nr:choice-of-anchor P family protein [Thermoleophilaceae bacterium]
MTARRLGILVASALGALAGSALLAPSAMAVPNGKFNCYATPVQLNLGSQSVDPFRAGVSGPCVNDKEGGGENTAGNPNFGTVTVRAAYGATETKAPPNRIPRDGDHVNARSGAAEVILVSGTNTIRLQALNASAHGECQSSAPTFSSESSTASATINGQPISHPDDGTPQSIPLGAATLHLNETVSTATSVIQRAARLENSFGSIVVGEAAVGVDGLPCEDDGTGNAPPPPDPNLTLACRSSAERISPSFVPVYEPVVANPSSAPCRGARVSSLNRGQELGISVLGNFAYTKAANFQAYAKAGASEVIIPTQPNPILFDGVNAEAFLMCSGGAPSSSSDSTVARLRIGTQDFEVGNAPFTYRNTAFTLMLNRRVPSATTLTRRAVDFTSPALGSVVVGEAVVGLGNTPCPAP